MSDSTDRSLVIEVKELIKTYKIGQSAVEVLKGVNLKIYKGESLAIMGSSGSGKSTFLHLLGCLDSPTSGSYFLNQKDVSNYDDESLAEIRANQIGFVFQSFNLIPQLTVFENVEVPFLYQSQSKSSLELKKIITESLERVGLGHRLYHHPLELSGGEMQRVAIARALSINPLLILADEPTGNLDTENGKSILKIFNELHQQGVTIVIVTHDFSVAEHCERLVKMKDGCIIEEIRNWN